MSDEEVALALTTAIIGHYGTPTTGPYVPDGIENSNLELRAHRAVYLYDRVLEHVRRPRS